MPLKRPILYLKHSNTQRKVYHSMPLHTYTTNFTTSSNVQLISNIPFTHLFVLIIYGITTHIGHKHHSNIIFYTFLTQTPPFSHFPSKNLNNYMSFLKYPRNAYMSYRKTYHYTSITPQNHKTHLSYTG